MRKLFSTLSSTLQGGVRGGLLFLALVATTSLLAHDFEVDGIYYNYLDGNNVKVTYRGNYYNSYDNEYAGEVIIPSTVTYNGTTYSVTSIGDYAFEDCSLASITIPNSVTSIGRGAFYYCRSLTSVTIGNSVKSIGNYAFYYCDDLTSVTIPNSVTSIGDDAFAFCSSLTSITIPNSVTSIGNSVFSGCSSLTSVTIPNSVTSIGNTAFSGCRSLTSVTIGNSVTSIGNSVFAGCSSLTSIVVDSTNAIYDSRDNCNAIIETATNILIAGCQNTIIPNSVTSIGNSAFSHCTSLTSITIPNSVTSIGESAFSSCTSLTSVTIPNSVTSIGELAFYGCSSLTSVTIGNSVTSIGGEAFRGCSSLTSVAIPESVTSIGSCAFWGCSSLTSVTIPNSVTSIGKSAFAYCRALTSITCEATTPPTVGESAFYDVSKSIPVYVPCGCVEAYKAASGWSDFTNIQEPLVKYSIEVNVNNTIMGSAKVDWNRACDTQISATPNFGYHFVQWSDGNTDAIRTLELTQDTILTAEFAQSFFGQCGDNLYWNYDTITQTISITGSGEMYNYIAATQPWLLFKEEIKEVTIANTATSIGTSAFEGCIRLGKISLGTRLKNIAANAFAGCTRLYDIYVYATYPPFAEESSFANYNVYLYVPCENQRDYILDIVWGKFKFIECLGAESEPVAPDTVIVTPGSTDVTITWPTEEGADTYTIVIREDGQVVCTLTFNAEGQLINIAFAPGRDGNHPAQYAEAVANGKGFRFTVTGLEEGTHYTYNIDVKNTANQTINSHTGAFTTQSTTAVDNITTTTANIQKIMRNGQLIILRDGVEYNAMGQEL